MTNIHIMRKVRALRRAHLRRHQNVVGLGIGRKRQDGELTTDNAIVVIVRKKVAKNKLKSNDLLPTRVRLGNDSVRVDVIQIAGFERQAFGPPYFCHDGHTQGTVTALARSDAGCFAVTCAHCIGGGDQDPYTEDPMSLYDQASLGYTKVGKSAIAVEGPGYGLPGDYGFSDVGLFSLTVPSLVARAQNANSLPLEKTLRRGTKVNSASAHGTLLGTIDMIEAEYGDMFVDLVVNIEGSGSFGGDSGMLWRNSQGVAVGIHAYGSTSSTAAGGSQYGAAMSISRAQKFLQVEFVEP